MDKRTRIFVSRRYNDSSVKKIGDNQQTIVGDYVDQLEDLLPDCELTYFTNSSDGSDLHNMLDDENKIFKLLRDKIGPTEITLVLVSKGMRVRDRDVREQWIPWEVAYSLSNQQPHAGGRPNGSITVYLPDENGSTAYGLTYHNDCVTVHYEPLFPIIFDNNFNYKQEVMKKTADGFDMHYPGGYCISLTWSKFKENPEHWINSALKNRDNQSSYNLYDRVDEVSHLDWSS